MGSDKVIPFICAGGYVRRPPPQHFKPEECRAWSDIVASMAPIHVMEEVDEWFLELAAVTLASFRLYGPHLDDLTRARHGAVLGEILEGALVPERAIKGLLQA